MSSPCFNGSLGFGQEGPVEIKHMSLAFVFEQESIYQLL